MSLMELYYITLRERGEDEATRLVALVKSWPRAQAVCVWCSDYTGRATGHLYLHGQDGTGVESIADCWRGSPGWRSHPLHQCQGAPRRGDSGVGKSGLAYRLTEDRFVATISTDAAWATQLQLPDNSGGNDIEREIWLWDFAGQADYRLIHQLYM